MSKIPKIYIESCPFIDLAKHHAKLTLDNDRETNCWTVDKFLEAARNGDVEVFTSMLSVSECTHVEPGKPQPDKSVQEFFEELLTSGKSGVTLVQLTQRINGISRDLRWKDGLSLRGADSIHLASAIAMGCSELLTTDGKLYKAANSIKRNVAIIQAKSTTQLPSKYKERELTEFQKPGPGPSV